MDKLSGHVNQYLAKLVSEKQLPTWDENDLYKYKKMYSLLKI